MKGNIPSEMLPRVAWWKFVDVSEKRVPSTLVLESGTNTFLRNVSEAVPDDNVPHSHDCKNLKSDSIRVYLFFGRQMYEIPRDRFLCLFAAFL
jgi:hypothetical protein